MLRPNGLIYSPFVDAVLVGYFMFQGPFDVCRKVFVGGEETATMSIHDKSDLFFQDYSFGPLFVQENYINVTPYAARYVRAHNT